MVTAAAQSPRGADDVFGFPAHGASPRLLAVANQDEGRGGHGAGGSGAGGAGPGSGPGGSGKGKKTKGAAAGTKRGSVEHAVSTLAASGSRRCSLIVDGGSLAATGFAATPLGLVSPDGVPVNAVSTCAQALRKLGNGLQPRAAVYVDGPAAADAHRAAASVAGDAAALDPQLPLIANLAEAFGFTVLPAPSSRAAASTEVRDAIAELAASLPGPVVIVSANRELLQCVSAAGNVVVVDPSSYAIVDEAEVQRRFAVAPPLVPDVLALIGDPGKGVPGVPGIGIKTAASLVAGAGGAAQVLAGIDNVRPASRRAALEDHRDTILRAVARAKVSTVAGRSSSPSSPSSSSVAASAAERAVEGAARPDMNALISLLEDLDLTTLIAQVAQDNDPSLEHEQFDLLHDGTYDVIVDEADLVAFVDACVAPGGGPVGIAAFASDTGPGGPHNPELVGIALSRPGRIGCYVPFGHRAPASGDGDPAADPAADPAPVPARQDGIAQIPRDGVLRQFRRLTESRGTVKAAHNLKTLAKTLRAGGFLDASAAPDASAAVADGEDLAGFDDAMVMSYALDCGRYTHHSLADCVENVLGDSMIELKRVVGVGLKAQLWHELDPRVVADYAAQQADMALRLHQALVPRLESEGMSEFYRDIELPLVASLARMEMTGVRVDAGELRDFAETLETRMLALEREVYALAGHEFLIHSPKQLGAVLFDELKLSHPSVKVKKSAKTGLWGTGSDVLSGLGKHHRLPQAVLEYRGVSKLRSTYANGLLEQINPATGRVHTVYQNALTTTGRLSSVSPNLQNIPNRSEEGRMIRRAFVADEGCTLLSADWSQVELRILAHIARIPALTQAFLDGADVHTRTAEEIFGTGDKEHRQKAKTINFGIIYGMSEFGLSSQLGVSRAVAREYIDTYFARFPEIRTYMDRTKELCRRDGFVYTLFGRKCWIPDISSRVAGKRGFAERAAINTPIQGTSADITKLAMNRLHTLLPERGFRSRMILQVHDELVFETPDDEREEVTKIIVDTMENVVTERGIKFAVPLPVDVDFSKNWAGFE